MLQVFFSIQKFRFKWISWLINGKNLSELRWTLNKTFSSGTFCPPAGPVRMTCGSACWTRSWSTSTIRVTCSDTPSCSPRWEPYCWTGCWRWGGGASLNWAGPQWAIPWVTAFTNCSQVSEVYSLHRQTAYLAQDFFDRFMLTQDDVSKECLQLLGITALFIASKIEVSPHRVFDNFSLRILILFLKSQNFYMKIRSSVK